MGIGFRSERTKDRAEELREGRKKKEREGEEVDSFFSCYSTVS